MKEYQVIEKSIIKTYRKEIWSKFVKTIKQYNLIEENDRIAVCLSGGKDSMLLAKCMQELQKHKVLNFELKFILMNPGYSNKNLEIIENNCLKLNIPYQIFKTNIFEMVKDKKNGCYLCAKKRRGHLYNKAKELGCNKIALGHHFDDVIETILLNILYSGVHQTMRPKLKSRNFENIELIRPLYLVEEKDIKRWQLKNNLEFINCACQFESEKNNSKRREMKLLIEKLNKNNKYVRKNIFKASENVNLEGLIIDIK